MQGFLTTRWDRGPKTRYQTLELKTNDLNPGLQGLAMSIFKPLYIVSFMVCLSEYYDFLQATPRSIPWFHHQHFHKIVMGRVGYEI
jgi:hypothetical protein